MVAFFIFFWSETLKISRVEFWRGKREEKSFTHQQVSFSLFWKGCSKIILIIFFYILRIRSVQFLRQFVFPLYLQVITINGAKILDDQKDIVIPQGIAHAIDRVMFPLPVGNLLQSLQADRENRYSNFLKVIEESELSYLLTGKSYSSIWSNNIIILIGQ